MFSWTITNWAASQNLKEIKSLPKWQPQLPSAKCICVVREKISSEFSIARSEGKKNKNYQKFIFDFSM